MTGNGVILAVTRSSKSNPNSAPAEIQSAMDTFIESQVLIPGQYKPIPADDLASDNSRSRLLRAMMAGLEQCKETV